MHDTASCPTVLTSRKAARSAPVALAVFGIALFAAGAFLAWTALHDLLHARSATKSVNGAVEWLAEPWLCGPELAHGQACGRVDGVEIGLRSDGEVVWRSTPLRRGLGASKATAFGPECSTRRMAGRAVEVVTCSGQVVAVREALP